MKKILITLLIVIPAFAVSGQASYNDSREEFMTAMQQTRKSRAHITALRILSVQSFEYKNVNKPGKLSYELRYDSKGNITNWLEYRKNGKIKRQSLVSYNDSNWVTISASYNGAGKQNWKIRFSYNTLGRLIEHDTYKRDSQKIVSKTINTYDNKNNIIESETFGKKGNLKSRTEYNYYDDGSKKQTTMYSAKGKIKQVWNFDCNPIGDLRAKKLKDTSKVCIHYETDQDGNPIKVKEEYAETGIFGTMERTVTKYNKDNNVLDVSAYKLNGKQTSHFSASYNSQGNLTEYIMYKAGTTKPWWRNSYTYTSDGNMETEAFYWRADQTPANTFKYVYNSSPTK